MYILQNGHIVLYKEQYDLKIVFPKEQKYDKIVLWKEQ